MRFLVACLEIWTGLFMCHVIFSEKRHKTFLKILGNVFIVVMSAGLGYVLYKSRLSYYVSPKTILICSSIATVGLSIIKRKNLLVTFSVVWTTYLLTGIVQIILSMGLQMPYETFHYDILVGVWPFTIMFYIGANLWMLLLALWIKNRRNMVRGFLNKNYFQIICMDIPFFLIICLWHELVKSRADVLLHLLVTFVIFVMIIIIVLAFLFADVFARVRVVEKENETLLIREEVARKQYEEMAELISQNRQMVHDIKNHLMVMKEFARQAGNDKIQMYIEDISKEYAVSMAKHWTGHPIVDFVLNQKILNAEKKNVEVTVKADTIGEIPLGESEICAMFGNLLDNAIEAVQKITDKKRWIEIYISQKKNMFFVEIVNNYLVTPVFEKGELVSTKGNSHGYGIKSVKRIVDKYDGMFTCKAGGGIFRVNLSFLSFERHSNTPHGNALYEYKNSCENDCNLTEVNGGIMKRKIVSIIFYILNLGLFIFPWIQVGEESYSVFQFALEHSKNGVTTFIEQAGLPLEYQSMLQGGIGIEVFLMLLYLVLSVIYVVTILCNKKKSFNLAVLAVGVVIAYMHNKFPGTIATLAPGPLTTALSLFFILIPAIEFFTIMVMERWDETVQESRAYAAEEKAWKEEVKRRLAFVGKYDKPFYRVVWKNFKANWKDYILLLFCCILIIGFVVVGFGVQKLMSIEYSLEGIQVLNGLGAILVNAIMPLAIVSVFMIVMLLFYYLKCRAKNYGVFLTLGMRRKALYYFAGLEFASVFVISVIVGGILGTGVLYLFTNYSEILIGMPMEFSSVGIMTYLKSILTVVIVFAISAMAAKEIFVDFNVGKSTDLRAIGEAFPQKFRKLILAIGFIICVFCLWQYGQVRNFEKVRLLIGFFGGLFIVIRYGLAEYLLQSRRKKKYIHRAVTESQLFHKSKTASGYILALVIMQVCILFYFSFQVISPAITEDEDSIFPYELVCIADDEDEDIFNELLEKHGVTSFAVPMVRVTNYDTTEKWEGRGEVSPQGQHIGISETTYHELKENLDSEYEAKDLGLDAEGTEIYIVHQQDKSIKAQPVDFYGTANRPILMTGQPTNGDIELARLSRSHDDTAFRYRKVVGEEFGSLTGAFRQGLRENIIVFSDEYFEVAKDMWEIIDVNSGILTTSEYYKNFYSDFGMTRKGPTTLVLFEDIPEEKMEIVEQYMQEFKERHVDDEVYDASVSSCYWKEDGIKNLQTERFMKMVMNTLVIAIFFIMNIILVSIKMLSELDSNRRRADFLTCMGMYKKDRDKLIIKEILVDHHLIPLIISMISALAFTFVVFHARMYSIADIQNYMKLMVPMWAAYILGSTVMIGILAIMYARIVEGKKYARRS